MEELDAGPFHSGESLSKGLAALTAWQRSGANKLPVKHFPEMFVCI